VVNPKPNYHITGRRGLRAIERTMTYTLDSGIHAESEILTLPPEFYEKDCNIDSISTGFEATTSSASPIVRC